MNDIQKLEVKKNILNNVLIMNGFIDREKDTPKDKKIVNELRDIQKQLSNEYMLMRLKKDPYMYIGSKYSLK